MENQKTPEELFDLYYLEMDSIRRGKRLKKLQNSGFDPEKCALMEQLYERRYKSTKHGTIADTFIGAWLEIQYMKPKSGSRRLTKMAKKALDTLCLGEETPFPQAMVYDELKHLVRCFVSLVLQTNRTILGFSTRSHPEAQKARARDEVELVTSTVPRILEMSEVFSPLARAAEEVLLEMFPDTVLDEKHDDLDDL